jgi:PAS domain S-box-containing protein
MPKPLRILIIEDSEDDTVLLVRQLRRDGYEPVYERVENADEMNRALDDGDWDVVITDYILPEFSGLDALKLLHEKKPGIPCIVMSGKITDETAVAAMKAGARDYVMKDNLKRLGPTIARELDEVLVRRQRAEAEQKLEASQTNFRNILLHNADAVLIIDKNQTVRFLNPAAEKLFGRPAREIARLFNGFTLVTDKNTEIEIIRSDGAKLTAEIRAAETDWEGQKALLATLRDITERKHMEQALRDSNEFNSSLMQHAPNPILVLKPDGSILFVNPALEDLTGFSSRELAGLKPPLPWWPEKDRERLFRQWKDEFGKVLRRQEKHYFTRAGEDFWIEVASIPIKNREGQLLYVLYSWINITEQKLLTEEMEYYVRKVTEAQEEERRRIARELHDDTAQSLSVLSLEVDSLINRNQDLTPETVHQLQKLKENINRSLNEVRRFSHELRPGLLDNLGLLAAIEQMIDEQNCKGKLKVNFEVSGDEKRLSPEIELALFRIVQESLSNIRKHSRATRATVDLEFESERVRLLVMDNGQGFDKSKERSAIASGHLGLIGMRERAHLVGAELNIESRPGKGTSVIVEIPANISVR